MRSARTNLLSALLLSSLLPAAFASPHARRGPTSSHLFSRRTAVKRPIGQAAIGTERTTQIQTALINHGYLSGEPTGNWDASTQAALQKLQGDNGWQTKFVPDSRAIIKLGLGPNAAAQSATHETTQDTASFAASSVSSPAQPESENTPSQR